MEEQLGPPLAGQHPIAEPKIEAGQSGTNHPPWQRAAGGLYSDRSHEKARGREQFQNRYNEAPVNYNRHLQHDYGRYDRLMNESYRREFIPPPIRDYESDVMGNTTEIQIRQERDGANHRYNRRQRDDDVKLTNKRSADQLLGHIDSQSFTLRDNRGRLNVEQVIKFITPLGDVSDRLAQNILRVATTLSRHVFSPALNSSDFKDISLESEMPSASHPGEQRSLVESNIRAIASAVVECATYLPSKSSVYASIVGIFGVHQTKLPEGLTLEDILTAVPKEVKLDPSVDERVIEKQAKADEAALRRTLLSCLVKTILITCIEHTGNHLSSGRIQESMNLMRFVMDMANCHLVRPDSALDLLHQVLHSSSECREASDICLAEPLVRIVMACLPWLSRASCEAAQSKFNEVIQFVENFMAQHSFPESCRCALSQLHTVTNEDTMTRAYCGIQSLTQTSSWTTKTLWRLYQMGSVADALVVHDAVVSHSLPVLSFSVKGFIDSLEKHGQMVSDIALGVDIGTQFRLAVNNTLSSDSQAYATAASEMGVGGGTLGANGCWKTKIVFKVWDDADLANLLPGIRPLELHDRWLLAELFVAVMHSFRHTPDLCADAILRIRVSHDEFEACLVEGIFNEMLQLPNSSEPSIFYFRLLHFVCEKQHSVYGLVEAALISLSHRCHLWDNQILEVLGEFFGFWLSILPEGPHLFKGFDCWSPESIRRNAHIWAQHGCELPSFSESGSIISIDDRQSQIMQQRIPEPLKLFISRAIDHLSSLSWSEGFASKFPSWVSVYFPHASTFQCPHAKHYEQKVISLQGNDIAITDNMTESAATEVTETGNKSINPHEYTLFRSLLQTRFASDGHKTECLDRLHYLIFLRLLGHPALEALPSTDYILNMNQVPHLTSKSDLEGVKTDSFTTDETNEAVKKDSDQLQSVHDICNENDVMKDVAVIVKAESGPPLSEDRPIDITEQNNNNFPSDTDPEDLKAEIKADVSQFVASTENKSLTISMSEPFVYSTKGPIWNYDQLVDLFVRALLGHGAKTLTHTSRMLENYTKTLLLFRPTSSRSELQIPKCVEEMILKGDEEYYAIILRTVFSCWKEGMIKCSFIIDKLSKFGIIPADSIQNYILKRLSIRKLNDLATQDVLIHLVREAALRMRHLEDEFIGYKRTLKFSNKNEDENKKDGTISALEESFYQSRAQVQNLVLNCLIETARRLTLMSSCGLSHNETIELEDGEEEGIHANNNNNNNDDIKMMCQTDHYHLFLENVLTKRLLHYGRTFIRFLNTGKLMTEINKMNPIQSLSEMLNTLHLLQKFLYPRGIPEGFDYYKKDEVKDEIV